jgi:hypothetical protein
MKLRSGRSDALAPPLWTSTSTSTQMSTALVTGLTVTYGHSSEPDGSERSRPAEPRRSTSRASCLDSSEPNPWTQWRKPDRQGRPGCRFVAGPNRSVSLTNCSGGRARWSCTAVQVCDSIHHALVKWLREVSLARVRVDDEAGLRGRSPRLSSCVRDPDRASSTS